jgi:hypothetical protein
MIGSNPEVYDVFLSYSHLDAAWVEDLAIRLEEQQGFKVWLDKWVIATGQSFQQAMSIGLDQQAKCCAVCIGEHTPAGWVREEIEKALNRAVKDPSFVVIPVLLPNSKSVNVDNFLELRSWVDFRNPDDYDWEYHRLVSGIKRLPPGRRPS